MDLATTTRQRAPRLRRNTDLSVPRPQASKYAIDEINAYIAVRDGLVGEAEQETTEASIERLVLANNFVANCLRPTGPHYLTQCLPELDSVRELKRCHAVDAQIAKLRALMVAAA